MPMLAQTPSQSIAPSAMTSGNQPPPKGGPLDSGSGQDFVLFEDSKASDPPFAASATPIDLSSSNNWQNGRPAFTDKPSFTQYRGAEGPSSSSIIDSPFESPATKLADSDQAGPSSLGSHGSSGTFSPATGVPNRKRQRASHEKSNSIGLPGAASGQDDQAPSSVPFSSHHRKRNSISLSSDIPGLSDTLGDDWTLADTSPQNPPSGSFGPALDSLSLGSGPTDGQQDGGLFPSLFPELGPDAHFANFDSFSDPQQATSTPSQGPLGGPAPTQQESTLQSNTASATALPPGPQTMQADPTPAQEATARRQVQRDLQGVDQRALRGPLKALAQQGPQTPFEHKVSQSQVESALKAAVDNFVAEADSARSKLANARAPGPGSTVPSNEHLSQDQRSLLFPGAPPTTQTQSQQGNTGSQANGVVSGNGNGYSRAAPLRPSVGPRKRSNSFDASFLPADRPWFSQSPPQDPLRPTGAPSGPAIPGQQPQLNQQQPQPQGSGMGTGTGWIGQPTNNFNAFDLGGAQAMQTNVQSSARPRPLTRDRSGLTVSPQETFLNFPADDASLMATIAAWQGGMFNDDPSTPTGRNPNSGKPPFTRGDTVRPSVQQQQHQRHSQLGTNSSNRNGPVSIGLQPVNQSSDGPKRQARQMTSASSASSDLSLVSPASSDTTNDDEDEKVYKAFQPKVPQPVDYDALLKQQQGHSAVNLGPWQASARRAGPGPPGPYRGPRFLASSGSSSEEEDDSKLAGTGLHQRQPGLPLPVNQMPLPPPTNPSQAPIAPGLVSGAQPLGRGRGLQGGYGYMPGSAESGMQVDLGSAGTTNPPYPTASAAGGGFVGFDNASQQSQDEERLSPSIRSNAQVISPQSGQGGMRGEPQPHAAAKVSKPAYGGYPVPTANSISPPGGRGGRSATSNSDDSFSTSSEGLDAAALDTGDSDYEASGASRDARRKPKPSAAYKAATQKSATGRGTNTSATSQSGMPMYGHSLTHTSQSSGITVCDYVSPLSGASCGTEFHRPYDLARHRETIHAKEEASLIRQGKLTKDQCRVLYVEVDPQRSQATQEWKCDGRNGCGSVFSRKDALQRHKRLRNH